ncbi:MAG: hypothetical protein KatS3mg057_0588 [Herpetosiphonaceae bacterium]|nr:MAG: hypothetical protein KatS3mg057_0588 [Herpetosiphonaceae bacterium]
MALEDPVVLSQLIGFGVFLWLGLYLLVRTANYRWLIVVSVVGLFSQAAFFGSNVLSYTTAHPETIVVLERWFWWTAVVPAAAWFHLSSLIGRGVLRYGSRRRVRLFTPPVAAIYTASGFIIALGTGSNLLLDYTRPVPGPRGALIISPGPAYLLYIAYMVVAAAGALVGFVRALRKAPASDTPGDQALRQQLRLLCGGALIFLAGALWIPSRYYWNLNLSAVPGYLFLFGGLAALGYGVAHFGLLLEGKNVRRDFIYSLTGIVLLNMLYISLIASGGPVSPRGMLALVGLVTLTHTAFDNGRKFLDRLFFSQAERTARAEARDYATALGTIPVPAPAFAAPIPPQIPLSEAEEHGGEEARETTAETGQEPPKEFKDQVRRAISGLKSPPRLAQSPLLSLDIVERRVVQAGLQDNRLNRAAALREILIEQIEALRPSDGASSVVGDAWRFYNVLYYPYVRELSRKGALAEARQLREERRQRGVAEPGDLEQVLNWLSNIDEDTFYKWQRRASDTIATLLWEENCKLRA